MMRTLASAVLLALAAAPAFAADVTVLTAHRIHTMDAARPQVEAMAFDAEGKVLALGNARELLAQHPGATRLDVGNATVVPGLIDAHGHMSGLGWGMLTADLVGTTSKAGILARLRDKARALKPGEWLIGRGWDQNDWPEQAFPTAAEIGRAHV